MSANVATFRDYKSGHIKRKLNQPAATPRAESIISDMSDGNLATEFIFSFAGFKYAASHLVLTLIGIMGDGQDSIELSDEDIAKIAECDTRTVQRWRAAYIAQAQKKTSGRWKLSKAITSKAKSIICRRHTASRSAKQSGRSLRTPALQPITAMTE
jgi:hypothetical protein